MEIGFTEMVVIVLVIIIFFGPNKIPEIARGLGQGIRYLRNTTDGIKREVMESANQVDPVKQMKEEVTDLKKEVNEGLQNIENTVKRLP